MTIEVTGCHDCPFYEFEYKCGISYISVTEIVSSYNKETPPSCPLKQGEITIKLKSDETNN